MYKITVKVDGMMCGMCENHINDAVRAALPVKKVTSSHTKGETVILAEREIPEDAVRAAIDRTGYRAASLVTESFEKKRLFGRGRG